MTFLLLLNHQFRKNLNSNMFLRMFTRLVALAQCPSVVSRLE